jgi:molybdenum cofactor guanylyltransferase
MRPADPLPRFDTVLLAGGAASRMGGADKPSLPVGGVAMLVSVATAAADAGTERIIVVGPVRTGAVQVGLGALAGRLAGGLVVVQEAPPGGGPVPALRRGLAEVTMPWVALLAADLPFLRGQQLSALLAAGSADGGADRGVAPDRYAGAAGGAVLADAGERPQWLAGVWRARGLTDALASYPGDTLRGLLAPLRPILLRCPAAGSGRAPWFDCDTPQDLAAARAAVTGTAEGRTEGHDDAGQLDRGGLR